MPLRLPRVATLAFLAGIGACAARTSSATAPTPVDAPILATIDSALLAIGRSDVALMRRHLLPGATFYGVRVPGTEQAFAMRDTAIYTGLARDTTPRLERYWAPRIERHGRLAIVTAPYDFWTARRFSHCGTDVFTLVEQGGRWRLASIAYTIQRTDCPASPLGAPRW